MTTRTTIHLAAARLSSVDPSLFFGLLMLVLFTIALSVAGMVAPPEQAESEPKIAPAPPVLLVITATPVRVEYQAMSAVGRKDAPAPPAPVPTPAPVVEYQIVYVPAPQVIDTTPEGGNSSTSTRGRP